MASYEIVLAANEVEGAVLVAVFYGVARARAHDLHEFKFERDVVFEVVPSSCLEVVVAVILQHFASRFAREQAPFGGVHAFVGVCGRIPAHAAADEGAREVHFELGDAAFPGCLQVFVQVAESLVDRFVSGSHRKPHALELLKAVEFQLFAIQPCKQAVHACARIEQTHYLGLVERALVGFLLRHRFAPPRLRGNCRLASGRLVRRTPRAREAALCRAR